MVVFIIMNKRKDLKWNFPQSFIRGGGHGHGHGHDPEHDKELFRKMTYYQLKEKPIDLILERVWTIGYFNSTYLLLSTFTTSRL